MMMLARFAGDVRGAALVEFGLVLPFLVGFAFVGVDVWRVGMRTQDMQGAVKFAAQYYMTGGRDDAAAKAAALQSWQNRPAGAEMQISRQCRCGSLVVNSCNTLCTNSAAPSVLVKIRASTPSGSGLVAPNQLADAYVRIR